MYWDDPGDSQAFVDKQRMKAKELINAYPELMSELLGYIKSNGFELVTNYRGDEEVSTCFINGGEYLSVRLNQRTFLSDNQRDTLNTIFPTKIGKVKFELLSIWDYDYDDERDWKPSLGLTCDILEK